MADTTPEDFEVKHDSVKDSIATLDSFLDRHNKGIGLGKIQLNTEAEQFLNLTYSELNKYDEQECNVASYILEQYALFLQKYTNRLQARHDWASDNIEKIVARLAMNYGDKFTKYEMRKQMIIADNEYAGALYAIVMETKVKSADIAFIVRNITSISNTLKSLAISKFKASS